MAATDYYRGSLIDNYNYSTPPGGNSPALAQRPSFAPYSASNISLNSPSPAPAYQSTERIALGQAPRFYHLDHEPRNKPDNLYSDSSLPLKPSSKLPRSKNHSLSQEPQCVESLESSEGPSLVPHPTATTKDGFFTGRIPWVVFITSLVQISVFIAEIIKNSIVTGSPIMIHPQFNPMIGPSTYIQINMGARFVPCMRTTPGVQDANPPLNWPCPNTTTSNPGASSNHCDLSALCGFGGLDDANPNQWFRFIVPMFLHAGLVHIGFNMLLQLTMGREMELAIGSIRFALVYFSSGIFGFVLGGNLAATAIASTGASGCLFGILALTLLDLIYCWNERRSPVKDLMWILCDVIVSFVLGLLPGLDNFSHIGGFLMGLASGICILHSPNILRQRIGDASSYRTMSNRSDRPKRPVTATATPADVTAFAKEPIGFFKARKPLWWAWWLLRVGALIGVLVGFIILIQDFYNHRDNCSWCKYLSCLPINGWCNIGNLQLNTGNGTNTTTNNKRDLLASAPVLVTELWARAGMS